MAVAVLIEIPGVTAAQYDAVLPLVWPGGHMPRGALFHVAGADASTWRVVDLWESAEAWDTFARDVLAPAMRQAGVTAQPTVRVWPVHNTAHTH